MLTQETCRNRLLKYLAPPDFDVLAPLLQPCPLERDFALILPDQPFDHVYFVESGMVSVVAERRDGRSIEVGVYGRDGFSGSSLLLGSEQTPHHHFMQIEGSGFRLSKADFMRLTDTCSGLRHLLLRFVHVFMTQSAQSALVNGSSVIEERLARWMLMCHDRVDGDDFAITHDFLSMMLGVRRSSVTSAIHLLESTQLIKAERGRIKILNRHNLEFAAAASYGVRETEYRRLIGPL